MTELITVKLRKDKFEPLFDLFKRNMGLYHISNSEICGRCLFLCNEYFHKKESFLNGKTRWEFIKGQSGRSSHKLISRADKDFATFLNG